MDREREKEKSRFIHIQGQIEKTLKVALEGS